MDRNTSFAFILIALVLFVWLYFNSPAPQPPKKKSETTLQQKDTAKPVQPIVAKEEKKEEEVSPLGNSSEQEKIVTIETELSRIELTNKGGRIKRVFLKKYNTWYNHLSNDTTYYKKFVQLVNTQKNGGDFNILFVTKEGKLVNTSSIDFNSSASNYYYILSGKDSLALDYTFTGDNGKVIKKSFVFYGSKYDSKVDITLENMQDVISSYRYDVVWQNGLNFVEENSVGEATYSQANVYTADELVTVDATKPGEKINKDLNGKIDWISVRNKYFAMILAPKNPTSEGGAYIEGTHYNNNYGTREVYNASIKVPFKNQKFQKDSFTLYLGPIDYYALKKYDNHYESIFEFGSLFGLKFIIRPISEYVMLPLLRFLDSFIPNYGLVIILFTIIIKLALHPLMRKSLQSMKKMQLLQPKIKEIKEKYNDPQKQQQETMKLYSTYGINPMGGCLPLLLQMPILVALWSLFNVAIDIRQQPFVFWITNLSSPDIIFRLPFKIPLLNIDIVSGLALLMGVTMFLQQKMSVTDPSQKAMLYTMPIMMTLMFMSMPAGLNLYYFVFNLLSIAQQYYVTHKHGDVELVPVANPKKKAGFMSRMMDAAEKQAQAQKELKKRK